jgi:tetratricopeptide (TPR) repeat protein/TolB-like protein
MISSVVHLLLRRRVPQILGVYLAVGWGVLEFTDWLVSRYLLSPHLVDFSLVAWATMIPTVLLLAWFHGAPGNDEWTRAEKIGIPSNLAVAAVILVVAFAGKDLGAATASVRLETEAGETVERVVPKAEFRKSVALFFFDNASGDTALHWLRYGMPTAIAGDLSQDLFLSIWDPPDFLERLRREGYSDGLDVPLALKRQVADHLHLGHFVTGAVSRDGDQLAVAVSLYETRRGRLLRERAYSGDDIFELADSIAVQLKRDLDLPEHYIEETIDLPVSQILTASEAAYRSFVDGFRALVIESDWEAAAPHFESAVEQDPQFAFAYVALFEVYTTLNQSARAAEAIETAMGLLYKLPESAQFQIKTVYYWLIRQDIAKALAAAEMHAELYPLDVQAHEALANLYTAGGERLKAIAALERMRELDPSRIDVLLDIGERYEAAGQFDSALASYRRYANESPNDPRALIRLGDLHRLTANHEAARQDYDRALVVDPGNVEALIRSAVLERDLGRFERAGAEYEEALEAAVTPGERALVYSALVDYARFRGQPSRAVDYMHLLWGELDASEGPFSAVQQKLQGLGNYVAAGMTDVALDSLRSVERQLSPPWDVLLPLGQLDIYVELEDADSIEMALEGVDRFIRALGIEDARLVHTYGLGKMFEIRGEFAQALDYYEGTLELQPSNVGVNIDIGHCYRELGRFQEAETHVARVLAVRPASPLAHYEIALVYSAAGDREKALEHLRAALEVWSEAEPGYEFAREARAALAELQ